MRKKILLILLLIVHIGLNAQTFKVTVDTMSLDIKEIVRPASHVKMTHAVRLNDKYYCFFRETGLYSYKIKAKYFLIISNNGTILHNIKVPKEIENNIYFDFFIRNGRMLAKTYMNHDSFYFDLNKLKWIKTEEKRILDIILNKYKKRLHLINVTIKRMRNFIEMVA